MLQGSQEEDFEKVWNELKDFLTIQTDREKTVKFVKWMKQKVDLAFGSEPAFQFPTFSKGNLLGGIRRKHRQRRK